MFFYGYIINNPFGALYNYNQFRSSTSNYYNQFSHYDSIFFLLLLCLTTVFNEIQYHFETKRCYLMLVPELTVMLHFVGQPVL